MAVIDTGNPDVDVPRNVVAVLQASSAVKSALAEMLSEQTGRSVSADDVALSDRVRAVIRSDAFSGIWPRVDVLPAGETIEPDDEQGTSIEEVAVEIWVIGSRSKSASETELQRAGALYGAVRGALLDDQEAPVEGARGVCNGWGQYIRDIASRPQDGERDGQRTVGWQAVVTYGREKPTLNPDLWGGGRP